MTAGLKKRHKKKSVSATTTGLIFFVFLCILRLSISRYYWELCKIILDDDDQQYIKVTELNEDGAEQNIVPINNIQKKSSSLINIRLYLVIAPDTVEQQHYTLFYPIRMVVHGIIILLR